MGMHTSKSCLMSCGARGVRDTRRMMHDNLQQGQVLGDSTLGRFSRMNPPAERAPCHRKQERTPSP